MTSLSLQQRFRLGLSPKGRHRGAKAPNQLAGLEFWYDAAQSPVIETGGAIERLDDISGNANHAGQATASARPVRTLDAAGRSVIRFDGSNDSLSVTTPPSFAAGVTVFLVFRMRARTDFDGVFSASAAAGTDHVDFFTFQNASAASGTFQLFGRSLDSDTLLWQPVDDGALVYAIFALGAGNGVFRSLDGSASDTYDGSFGTPDEIVLGARFASGLFGHAEVDLLEVGLYARKLGGSQLDALEAHLRAKYQTADGLMADHAFTDGQLLGPDWSFSRPSAGATRTHLGTWRQAKSGELRLEGLRRNAYGNNIPKLVSSWNLNGKAGAGTAPVITNNFGTDPDGTPAKATRVVLTPGGTTSGDYSLLRHDGAFTDAIAVSRRTSLWMKLNTGSSTTIRITSAVQSKNVVVTDTWQRFAAGADTSPTCRVIIQARGDLAGAGAVDLLIANGDDYGVMLAEDSNGAPQEYVNPGRSYNAGAQGVRYLTTTNGNTVGAGGVVTEAAGSLISASTRKGALLEPQRTNLITRSYDLTTGWTGPSGGTGTEALDATGIDGVASRASTIADTDAANLVSWSIAPTLSGTTAHVLSVLVDKDADTSRFPELLITGYVTDIGVQLNTSTGASATRTGSPVFVVVEDAGAWWWLKIGFTATSTTGSVRIYPARGATLGGDDASATGSIIVGHVQLEAGVFASSPIRTAGSTVTRLTDSLTLPAPGVAPGEIGTLIGFELANAPAGLTTSLRLFGSDDSGGTTEEIRTLGAAAWAWTAAAGSKGGTLAIDTADLVAGTPQTLGLSLTDVEQVAVLDGNTELDDGQSLALDHSDSELQLGFWDGTGAVQMPGMRLRSFSYWTRNVVRSRIGG